MAEHKHHLAGHREHEQIVAALADPAAWFMRELLHAAAASGRHDRAQTHPPRRSPPAWPCCLAARPRPHACRGGGKLAGWRRTAGARQVVGGGGGALPGQRQSPHLRGRECGSSGARWGSHPQAAGRVRSGLLAKDQATATVRHPGTSTSTSPQMVVPGPAHPDDRGQGPRHGNITRGGAGRGGLAGQGSLRLGGGLCHDGVPRSGPTGGGQSRATGSQTEPLP